MRAKANPWRVRIARYLAGGTGLLALPNGCGQLANIPGFSVLKTNRLGTVLVEYGPGLVIYEAQHGPGATFDSPPTAEDLDIPQREDALLARMIVEHPPAPMPPR